MKEENYCLKQMSVDNLAELDEIMKVGHFNWGVFNWRCCFDASPETFYFVVKNGKRIGVYTENKMTDKFIYGHAMVILPQYRSKGAMHWIYGRFAEKNKENKNVENIADNKNSLVLSGLKMSFIIGHKIIEYGGNIKLKGLKKLICPENISLKQVENEEDLRKIISFDSNLYSKINLATIRRSKFISDWTSSEHAKTIIAIKNNSVAGFGTIRVRASISGIFDFMLCPVYAIDSEVGLKLLETLIETVPENSFVSLQFPADNLTSLKFCQDYDMKFLYSEFRTYTNKLLPLPLNNVFSSHDFWPF